MNLKRIDYKESNYTYAWTLTEDSDDIGIIVEVRDKSYTFLNMAVEGIPQLVCEEDIAYEVDEINDVLMLICKELEMNVYFPDFIVLAEYCENDVILREPSDSEREEFEDAIGEKEDDMI